MKKLLAVVLALSPLTTFAQIVGNISDVNSLTTRAINIGNVVIELIIALSVIWIIINVFKYLVAGDETSRKTGGMAILYGVIALFVMLSIWGLVSILKKSFALENTRPNAAINEVKNTTPTPIQ